ncbi:MAG: discoidin domain-containing protein, partial [Armatimonadota bacterium]
LHKRNIPLLLYYTGDGPRADERAGPAFGCGSPVSNEFVQKWADVAREYGERYGEKIAGYWVDGAYPFIGYDEAKLAVFSKALKAGNPKRIIAFNRGVDPLVMSYTKHEDYTCGEQNSFYDMPSQRFLDGEQWHILSYLGPTWAQPGTKYTKQELADYVYDVNQRGGVVSIDVTLYRDGSLDRSQVEMLKAVRDFKLKMGGRAIPAVPAGNLAFRKQAKLLSLDGSHELVVNSGVCFPRLGVDGRPETYALAGGEWPWTYQVDLVDTVELRRMKLTFAGGYATQFEFQVSVDGQAWQTVAQKANHDGTPFEATFAAVSARYIRVCSQKPDGPDQKGSQMTVAEMEAYE